MELWVSMAIVYGNIVLGLVHRNVGRVARTNAFEVMSRVSDILSSSW